MLLGTAIFVFKGQEPLEVFFQDSSVHGGRPSGHSTPDDSSSEIIEHGVNGFLVDSKEEWYNCIRELVNNPELRHWGSGRSFLIERKTRRDLPDDV